MGKLLDEYYNLLIKSVLEIKEVVAIGKSGGKTLPVNGESDIDVYIFCNRIPKLSERQAAIQNLGNAVDSVKYSENSSRFWGTMDFLYLDNTEICLMYFTTTYMNEEIESVLDGRRLYKEDGIFYPTGRCATML